VADQRPGHQNRPIWSGDGTYVYYSETEGNQQDIWRIPSTGGVAQQVTRTGSVQAYEVTSGRFLVYQNGDGKKPLLLLLLGGGIARQIVACVQRAGFAARRDAVYYVGCEPWPAPPSTVWIRSPAETPGWGHCVITSADFASVWRPMARPFCTRGPAFPSVRS
jgi:hypothetical protein